MRRGRRISAWLPRLIGVPAVVCCLVFAVGATGAAALPTSKSRSATMTAETLPLVGIGRAGATFEGHYVTTEFALIWFDWGTTTAYGNVIGVWGTQPDDQKLTVGLTDLLPATTYHYRFGIRSMAGGPAVYGIDRTFKTLQGSKPKVSRARVATPYHCRCAVVSGNIDTGGYRTQWRVESSAGGVTPWRDLTVDGVASEGATISAPPGKHKFQIVAVNAKGSAKAGGSGTVS